MILVEETSYEFKSISGMAVLVHGLLTKYKNKFTCLHQSSHCNIVMDKILYKY
jgi:hypothetical protein